jgi:hypothetical protein
MTSIVEYIASALLFTQRDISGEHINVLSHDRIAMTLKSQDELTTRVISNAWDRQRRYLNTFDHTARQVLPQEVVYYVWDRIERRVLGLITADGTVELTTTFRTRQQERSLREGFAALKDTEPFQTKENA